MKVQLHMDIGASLPSLGLVADLVAKPSCRSSRAVMADEDEFERPRKIPKTLKEKDSGKRLIVILEKASLETVKVLLSLCHLHVQS